MKIYLKWTHLSPRVAVDPDRLTKTHQDPARTQLVAVVPAWGPGANTLHIILHTCALRRF